MNSVDLFKLIFELIKPELLIIAVMCYVLGLFIKNIPNIKNWLIPFIILFFGILLSILYLAIMLTQGFTGATILTGVMQGFLCAALAVYGNEMLKQLIVKRPQDNNAQLSGDGNTRSNEVSEDKT